VDNHPIRIVRTISATTVTPKLNTRIRLSPPASEIRLAAPANPLASHAPSIRLAAEHSINVSAQKKRIYQHYKQFKNAAAVDGRINVIVQKADRNLEYGIIAIVTLLLCEIAAPAEQPIVIEDSEAAKYVGKVVEVRGRVVSVTTSPLGTTFINFGGEYPNQRFAGFIAAGSKITSDRRLAMIQGKIISITGRIELRKGKPEINIVSADQTKGLDSPLIE